MASGFGFLLVLLTCYRASALYYMFGSVVLQDKSRNEGILWLLAVLSTPIFLGPNSQDTKSKRVEARARLTV